MLLRLSRFVHLLPAGNGRTLVVDAISQGRLVVNDEIAAALRRFANPIELPPPQDGLLKSLIERGILTDQAPDVELEHVAELLRPYHGRDPEEMIDRFRRASRQGGETYWATTTALTPED